MRLAPIELTASDFEQLGTIDPGLETKGREAHRQAQLAIVQQHTPIQTKDARPDRARRPVTRKQLETFADRFGTLLIEMVARTSMPLREEVTALTGARAGTRSRGGRAGRGVPC